MMIALSISVLLANLGVVFCSRATLRFYEEHQALREQFLLHQARCDARPVTREPSVPDNPSQAEP